VKKTVLFLLAVILLTGCKAYQQTVYLQNAGNPITYNDSVKSNIPDPTLKVGDLLIITVNSNTPEVAAPFNLPLLPGGEAMKAYSIGSGASMSGSISLQNYLVDTKGDIVYPIIGKIHVLGMTKSSLAEYLKDKIYPYYIKEEPIIMVRFAEYKISVLGEIARPGSYNISNEKISIFEAIAEAGDLTIYGQRDNVLLVRETVNGKRETVRIDLRDKRLIDSPYYYLQQNDVLYIQPNDSKSRSSFFGSAVATYISLVGTLISVTSLIVNLVRK